MASPVLSIICPAHNEAGFIGACLEALLASDVNGSEAELIIVANACTDDTVSICQSFATRAQELGWGYQVINSTIPGKLPALNTGDDAAQGAMRAYLDADVIVSPELLPQVMKALRAKTPRYASGAPVVSRARSRMTRAFARIWQQLPFVTQGTPGFGFFAVNAAGRARWDRFPEDIISDDTFVRLQFAAEERVRVTGMYEWPMVEGLRNLVRVRRRQDEGVAEIEARFPELLRNAQDARLSRGETMRLALRDPVGFAAYGLVKLLVKTPYARSTQRWARGR